ncbi:ribonuclease H-like domain-containing protein [Tanacetum coccineum]
MTGPDVKPWRPCFNFAKGSCRFGNDYRFVHNHNAKNGDYSGLKSSGNNTDELLVKLLDRLGLNENKHAIVTSNNTNNPSLNPNVATTNTLPVVFGPTSYYSQSVPTFSPIPSYMLAQHFGGPPGFYYPLVQPHASFSSSYPGNMGPNTPSGQATTLSHVFNTETLRDLSNGAWNMDTDGTLSRYKARLVASGSTKLEGVDVNETFSPVVKPGTIRTVLSLAASRHWPIHQLDVKNAFLHGDLSETVYMHQPPKFWDSVHPDYVYRGTDTAYLLLYVDDIVLTASSDILLQQIIRSLHQEFAMTDLGTLNYFLGISVSRDSSGLFLSQKKYIVEILDRAHMVNCNSSRTPVDTESKLEVMVIRYSPPLLQIWLLIYMLIGLVVQLLGGRFQVIMFFLATICSLGPSKRQPTLSHSSAEAEYRGVANAVAETCWLRNLLRELHTSLTFATLVYCDNVSAVYLSCNPVQHQRTKHIEINIHFVRDLVVAGQVRMLHVPSRYQFTDIFTKGLPSALSVRCPPAPTAGEC